MSHTDEFEQSGVLVDVTYDKEYRRLRTLSSRTDIRQVSVSVNIYNKMPQNKQTNYNQFFVTHMMNNEHFFFFIILKSFISSFVLIFQFSQLKMP